MWGLAGMVLFLPFAAMLRVVCEAFEELKPIALMIGEQNKVEGDGSEAFIVRWWKKVKARVTK